VGVPAQAAGGDGAVRGGEGEPGHAAGGGERGGAPHSLSLSTKVENAVSGCVGAPRCTASRVHEERRVLSVR